MVICVTGKIGSGKSEASRIISRMTGYEIVNVDEIGHEVLKLDDVKERIKKEFGEEIFSGGEIDRRKLGKIVFKDEKKLRKLEEIVHPVMREIVKERVKNLKNAVVDCALLERMDLVEICDIVITLISSYETALRRKRIDEERFRSIWNSQEDIRMIGVVIENEGSLEDLERKLREVLGIEERAR